MNPLVSIIIPTFNRTHLIGETLDSIIAQTYTNWECIVVDDGSTDSTAEVVEIFIANEIRISLFRRPAHKKKGPSACRNYGLEKASGKYVLFLDSDDLITIDCLKNRIEYASQNRKFDWWIFKTKIFTKDINDTNKIFNWILPSYSDAAYLKIFFEGQHPFCVCSPLWKTAALNKIKGFDENLIVLEDPELHIRAFISNLKSMTSDTNQADTFYRQNSEKQLHAKTDKTAIAKHHNATLIIFKKYLIDFNKELSPYCIDFYKNEILYKGSVYCATKFYLLFLKVNILNFRQIICLPILNLYKFVGIDKVKGAGFYQLRQFLFSSN